jgi:hypothetical protein
MLPAAQKGFVGRRYGCLLLVQCELLHIGQVQRQGIDDGVGDLVLEGEDVGDRAVIAIGPHMAAAKGIDELGVDSDLVAARRTFPSRM